MISQLQELASRSMCSNSAKLEEILSDVQPGSGSLVLKLIGAEICNEELFLRQLGEQFGFPYWEGFGDLKQEEAARLRSFLPSESARRKGIVPVAVVEEEDAGPVLYLASSDPFDLDSHSIAARETEIPFNWMVATRETIREGVQSLYGVGDELLGELIDSRHSDRLYFEGEESMVIDDSDENSATVISFVNEIIRGALEQEGTDIHLEPWGRSLRVRYRIDGKLKDVATPENMGSFQLSVVSRIKIMAGLDIAERRLPQDGRIHLEQDGRPIDVRVATIPSVEGESVSLRLLGQEVFDLEKLGMDDDMLSRVKNLLELPNGIILVTGPTGSGKSTSLYAFLSEINRPESRIVTIEDPVENKIKGVVQIAVKNEIGLTFARGLRSILRGDPNVIMVGEMRDLETAEIAIRAALTGHLVFSTLHTNDAISGVTRLIDMGVEPFLIASSVRAFIAQRLVRKLCKNCRKPHLVGKEVLEAHGWTDLPGIDGPLEVYRATGCSRCRGTGYRGRLAIYELATVTSALEELISRKAGIAELMKQAVADGYIPMRLYGIRKVLEGETSLEEVLSVTVSPGAGNISDLKYAALTDG